MSRQPFSRVMPRATRPLECTHCDLLSISNLDMPATESGVRHGMKYGVVFVDDFSRHMRVYFCTHKSEVPRLLRLYFTEMGSHALYASHFLMHQGFARHRIHTNGGTELNSAKCEQCLLDLGLSANVVTAPDTPSSNGVAERAIRTLCSATRARLAMSGLPNRLWTYAMTHSAAFRNRLATQLTATGESVTPSKLFYGQRPDMSHMVAFGAPCLVALQGPALRARGKLQLRSVPGKILHHGMEGIQRDGGGQACARICCPPG
jgi:hypothetical protein